MSRFEWQKSSFSEGHTEACVEVAAGPGGSRRVRESTGPETVLGVSAEALAGLLRTLKAGMPDRPSG
ncbi:hypothetical protein A6A06_03270 [Streptomyces sp. CB02923]|uniref:DUF397 domain-containing protein n=1 Tax=Streptomyces sp. CB02923 TaxID=1718985 RepID=UPI00093A2765|nr:DUF397 domain-containing protein [Streptomyces sp. CB02923]OKI09696.1 hypothetical protein A6A06_03270 [Streptomyces sp. CB02923]